MTADDLRTWITRRPFVPFRVHVVGGSQYDVPDPTFVMQGRTWVFFGLRKDVTSFQFDDPVLLMMHHIERVEPTAG